MSPESEPPEQSALPLPATVKPHQGSASHPAHGPFHTLCENCGTKLEGPFCHQCGQHDFEFHRSFGHVFLEVLENFLHFDTKLFRNTLTLLFRPGRLTAEFNAGRRTAQMPPFRLYLFVSVLFFFLLYLEGDGPAEPFGDKLRPLVQSNINGKSASPLEALHSATLSGSEENAAAPGRPAAQKIRPAGGAKGQLAALAHHASDPAHRQELVEHFFHGLPKMLLLCLPIFALYTRLLFRQSGQVYLQHLVLALHFHTFIYLWLMTRNGWVFLVGLPGWGLAPVLRGLCDLWLYVYPFMMLRHLFRNSWRLTLLKTFSLLLGYSLTLALVMFASVVVIFELL